MFVFGTKILRIFLLFPTYCSVTDLMAGYDTTQILVFAGLVTVIGLVVAFAIRKLAGDDKYMGNNHLLWVALTFAITGALLGVYAQANN